MATGPLFALLIASAAAQPWFEVQKIVPPEVTAGDYFGCSVAAAGNVLVVGARFHKPVGAAFVYRCELSFCTLTDKLLPTTEASYFPSFGDSVAVSMLATGSGAMVVVGEYDGGDKEAGCAYVYNCPAPSQCVLFARLDQRDGVSNDYFGSHVAVTSTQIVFVAAHSRDDTGCVYAFDCTLNGKCAQTAQLKARDAADGDVFGWGLAAVDGTVVVGAYAKNSLRGAAYVFVCSSPSSCSQTLKLTASDSATGDFFGNSVAISGTRILVGAFRKSSRGAAYLFECSTPSSCVQAGKIMGSDNANSEFGCAVAMSGTRVVAGGHYKNSRRGAAYVFDCPTAATCTETAIIVGNGTTSYSYFGEAVAIIGANIAVGAPEELESPNSGAAHLFAAAPVPSQCAFAFGNVLYDLTALRGEYKTPNVAFPVYTEYIAMCGQRLNVTGCPALAAVCEVGGTRGVSFGIEPGTFKPVEGGLDMTFALPDESVPCQSASIFFICDPKAANGAPVHVDEGTCGLRFNWRTAHACPSNCRQVLGGVQFDLSPLAGKTYTVPNSEFLGYMDHLTVCDDVIEGVVGCNGSSACQTFEGGRPAILGDAPVSLYREGDNVIHSYTKRADSPYSAIIVFSCDSAAGAGEPKFVGVDGSGFRLTYSWASAFACPIGRGTN